MRTYTEEQVIDIIGSFYKEADGWDVAFARKEWCCPGDDNADVITAVKPIQLKKAGIEVTKKRYEAEAGLIWNGKDKLLKVVESIEACKAIGVSKTKHSVRKPLQNVRR